MMNSTRKNMIFFDPYPKGKDDWSLRNQKPHLFMKYFPKYLKNLTINSDHGAVKSKVKRTKVIQDLKRTEYYEKRSYWRTLLSNKMKTVSNTFQSKNNFIEKIKLFSGLQSIQLIPRCDHEEPELHLCKKANKKMFRLTKLKSLKIEIWGPREYYFDLLEGLNSLPKLLKSLDIVVFFKTRNEYFPTLVEDLKINQNVLVSLSSFTIEELSSPEHHQAFKSLADSCPNLHHLSFEFSCRSTYFTRGRGRGRGARKHFSETRLPAHANCLRTLKTFPNLRSLDLKIADNEAFMRYFVLPPGVRWLSLEFEEDSKLFEKDYAFFNENVEHLENLETLKLIFNEDHIPDNYEDQNKLSQCILRKVPSLKKFIFVVRNSEVERMKWEYENPIEDCCLPQLLESCPQSLETIEINTYEKILYSEYDFSSLQNKFPNLKTIKFKGSFYEDNPKLIGSLLQKLISLGNSITTIDFTVIFGDEEFFFGLFDELEKVQIPDQLKLMIKTQPTNEPYGYQCRKDSPKEQMNEQKLLPKFRRISLLIFTFFESWHMAEFLESFADRFDHFEIIDTSQRDAIGKKK